LAAAPIPVQTHILRLEERTAQGKALRNVAARSAQKAWKPSAGRADPVDLLIKNSKGRVEELLPIRYGRMMASPFAFYGGANPHAATAPAAQQAPTAQADVITQLERLGALKAQGLLTEEEFAAQKAKLLGS